ncbi:thermonuclease family protein [Thioalkalivibrio sp. ALJ7]|uniref:thermonuclease family protein n=1 Tax=Thioalkalivibrio sp. ALJ7 TaxID=1158756 RepID=UPI0005703CE5|nr:nuclease [Thioalkalivibrio sp. ALJ7]
MARRPARDATGRVAAAAGRGRPNEGALWGALVCVGGLLLLFAQAVAAQCQLADQDARGLQEVEVDRVQGFDGLQLADGRSIRLIGLAPAAELPETSPLMRPLRLHEDLQDVLDERIDAAGQRLILRPGRPARDAQGRLHMHAWLPEGPLLASELIASGAAVARPGLQPSALDTCYYNAEAEARAGQRGLWLERPAAFSAMALDRHAGALRPGRLRVQGEVVSVRSTERHWVLELDGPLDVFIHEDDRAHWPDLEPDTLNGEAVIVRGQVYPWRDRLRIRIRNPRDLEVVE